MNNEREHMSDEPTTEELLAEAQQITNRIRDAKDEQQAHRDAITALEEEIKGRQARGAYIAGGLRFRDGVDILGGGRVDIGGTDETVKKTDDEPVIDNVRDIDEAAKKAREVLDAAEKTAARAAKAPARTRRTNAAKKAPAKKAAAPRKRVAKKVTAS